MGGRGVAKSGEGGCREWFDGVEACLWFTKRHNLGLGAGVGHFFIDIRVVMEGKRFCAYDSVMEATGPLQATALDMCHNNQIKPKLYSNL